MFHSLLDLTLYTFGKLVQAKEAVFPISFLISAGKVF